MARTTFSFRYLNNDENLFSILLNHHSGKSVQKLFETILHHFPLCFGPQLQNYRYWKKKMRNLNRNTVFTQQMDFSIVIYSFVPMHRHAAFLGEKCSVVLIFIIRTNLQHFLFQQNTIPLGIHFFVGWKENFTRVPLFCQWKLGKTQFTQQLLSFERLYPNPHVV